MERYIYQKVRRKRCCVIDYAKNLLQQAEISRAGNLTFILHSEANNVAFDGISSIVDDARKKGIKINIVSIGSPSPFRTIDYLKFLKQNKDIVRYENFVNTADPIAWLSLSFLNPDTHYILGLDFIGAHGSYFSDSGVRQTALSMATGVNIPIGYSNFSTGSFSDPYFSGTFSVRETVIYPSPDVRITQTNITSNYGSNYQIFSNSSIPSTQFVAPQPFNSSSNYQVPDFSSWNGSSFKPLPSIDFSPPSISMPSSPIQRPGNGP
ncbi:MAG: hypothetical protein PHC29_03405 [Candidatus Omnitrophica bacterium]|nr:hypothetical protein [Candidatus Omnitrophota bacterium]